MIHQLIGVVIEMEGSNIEKVHLIHLFFHFVETEMELSTLSSNKTVG